MANVKIGVGSFAYIKVKEDYIKNHMAADMEVQNQKGQQETEEAKDVEAAEGDTVSPELLIKHPLQNTWTLWFYKQDSTRSWEESQMIVASFQTVEDFWALYNHIELASKLKTGCDYSLFKQGIKPMWEDKKNNKGGRWIINLSKHQRATELDNFWMEMLLLLIGEAFEQHSEEVCGAVVNVRNKGDKVGVWTRDALNGTSIVKIGHKVKISLHLPPGFVMHFFSHSDTATKQGSALNSLYQIQV